MRPILQIFAGPNGSGKSTITAGFPVVGRYVNADEIQRLLGCSALEAAENAEKTRRALLAAGQDLTYETVFSTRRHLDFLRAARDAGYATFCVYVLTRDPEINFARVRARVARGGHDVPPEKIRSRFWRAMALIPELCAGCDRVLIFDNSRDRADGGPALLAEVRAGQATIHPAPGWTQAEIAALLRGEYKQP